jgi:hypothetical protein
MAKADCIALVATLSNNQADPNLASSFYDDLVSSQAGWHTTATPITFTAQTSTVPLPPDLLSLLQLIYDNDVLSQNSLRELEAIKYGWRSVSGRPIAFTFQAEPAKVAEVFPVPPTTSPLIIPVHGLPVGQDYAPGNGIAIYDQQVVDILPYLNLPFALKILAREYSRESDHMSADFAAAAGALGDMLLGMLRIDGADRESA